MNRQLLRLGARQRRRVERGPFEFRELPRDDWPRHALSLMTVEPLRVWVSSAYLVQQYPSELPWHRLTVSRLDRKPSMQWPELQRIKTETVGDVSAIQVFPIADNVVDVANLYHLWFRVDGESAAPHGCDLRG